MRKIGFGVDVGEEDRFWLWRRRRRRKKGDRFW